ncbi:mas-related G-protein coupled receptor member H-like [Hemicordylus capensis]|uniref:mas-related G-protein coupled receptor member H-like n=1 Tax=Hemicordylus capensis TaxID=884348 RepID=UPI002303DAFB|nr:mas-related G-protein coupled receptor member H-like [Hemicordylus capensis]
MMAVMTPTTSSAEASNSCWTPNNNTECQCLHHTFEEGIVYIINQFICLFGLLGNGIVLWYLRRHLRKNFFIFYVFSLAVADFGFLLCCLFVVIMFTAEYFRGCNFPWCTQMCPLFRLELYLYSTSMYFLTAISMERCLCAISPFWYSFHRPKWLSSAITGVLWSFPILLAGINIFSYSLTIEQLCQHLSTIIVIANLYIFTPIMILSSLILFIKMRCYFQGRQPGHLYRTILLTVLFFSIFAIPLSAKHLRIGFAHSKFPEISYLLASVNSSINPVIYFLVGSRREKWFKESLNFILQRALNEEKDSRETGKVSNTQHGDEKQTKSEDQRPPLPLSEVGS